MELLENWLQDYLENWLQDYEDRDTVQFLRYGWPLNAQNTEVSSEVPRNQVGARANVKELKEYLKNERFAGTVIGPFRCNPFGPVARFSPLDTCPKKDSEELRVILNLLYPFENGSVNSSIRKETYINGEVMNLKYPSVDDLAKLVRRKGRKCRIFIRDLSKAYRQLFMCPASIHLLGYWYDNELYFDITLSMGSRSAVYCCQRTTNAVTCVPEIQI